MFKRLTLIACQRNGHDKHQALSKTLVSLDVKPARLRPSLAIGHYRAFPRRGFHASQLRRIRRCSGKDGPEGSSPPHLSYGLFI
jgi:hypothetical protein